ncbi:MAG: hypothetical protein U0270_15830 [Labilithrix sp.]
MDRRLHLQVVEMNLRCTFHVSPMTSSKTQEQRPRMPSVVDIEVDYVEEPMPRGRSHETWTRARGWGSED